MLWDFVVWLLVLAVQAALLGIVMFSVSCSLLDYQRLAVSSSRAQPFGLLGRV